MGRLLTEHKNALSVDAVEPGSGCSALVFAANSGNANMLRMLLTRGADPNVGGSASWARPLHSAARNGRLECLQILLAAGARVNEYAQMTLTPTPLHAAAWGGSGPCVRALLEAGADPTLRTADGSKTALDVAVKMKRQDAIDVLQEFATKRTTATAAGGRCLRAFLAD
jgi:ankyrin repeat protein